MNTMLSSAQDFLEGMTQEELFDWFQKGATKYYDRKISAGKDANHHTCLSGAFEQMRLTLGNSQHSTTLYEEFNHIYPQFSKELQGKFQLILGESVKTIPTQGGSIELIKDLIILALDTQYEGMADILAEFLPKIQDTQLKKAIYEAAVFFFEETTNLDSVSRLIQVYFADTDVPHHVYLKLIMARIRIGTAGILDDIRRLDTDKIHLAVAVKNKYPHIVKRFSDDLEAACGAANIQVAEILRIIEPDTAS